MEQALFSVAQKMILLQKKIVKKKSIVTTSFDWEYSRRSARFHSGFDVDVDYEENLSVTSVVIL